MRNQLAHSTMVALFSFLDYLRNNFGAITFIGLNHCGNLSKLIAYSTFRKVSGMLITIDAKAADVD